MLQLNFDCKPNASLEIRLGTYRYQRFWEEHSVEILQSFKQRTGLDFAQRRITVRGIDEPTSRAGNPHQPMELTIHRVEMPKVGVNLLHELAHRLVIGNGIDSDARHWSYLCHCHIDLFLYDVWADVLGKDAAEAALEAERNNGYPTYRKAWDWALAKTPDERRRTLERLKRKAAERAPKPSAAARKSTGV
ncbi:MAG TPA: hypothetical protein VLF91_01710 [Candidatus Saccharimonadales bacterium]|nr:hypothetical protein [Candidatus Saccharimonadales bacterium]